MQDAQGAAGFDDLALLVAATLAFSLFFGAVAGAYVAREAQDRGDRLQSAADRLLAAILADGPWIVRPGLLDPDALVAEGVAAIRPISEGHPFEVVLRDLSSRREWTVAEGPQVGERRTAATAVSLLRETVDPGRLAVTVWSP